MTAECFLNRFTKQGAKRRYLGTRRRTAHALRHGRDKRTNGERCISGLIWREIALRLPLATPVGDLLALEDGKRQAT